MGGVLANLTPVALCSGLPGMGVKRSLQCGGTLLGLLANISTVLSTATNYWIRFPTGHSGMWQDCTQGTCSNMPCQCEAQAVQMLSDPPILHHTDSPSTDHSWTLP